MCLWLDRASVGVIVKVKRSEGGGDNRGNSRMLHTSTRDHAEKHRSLHFKISEWMIPIQSRDCADANK